MIIIHKGYIAHPVQVGRSLLSIPKGNNIPDPKIKMELLQYIKNMI